MSGGEAAAAADAAGWEDTKENFVPLKQGRTAAAVLATPLSNVKKGSSEVEAHKRSFLAAIEAAADDPMPAWLKYIKWTQEQCCVQGGKGELQAVLEAATSSLTAAGRYHGDVRLLRIWVQYADCLPDPSDVFLYLEDQGIGRHHALLYEAYATYLELAGAFSHAELVYTEGINRLAKPLDRLKQKQAAFQQRMAKRMQRQASEAALGMAAEAVGSGGVAGLPVRASLAPLVPLDAAPLLDENGQPIIRAAAAPGRHARQQQPASVAMGVQPALATGSSRGVGSGLWAPASMGGAAAAAGGGGGLGSLRLGVPGMLAPGQQRGDSSSSAAAANTAPRALQVHVDDEFGPRGTGAVPTAFPPALQQHAALPGLAAVSKENSSQPGTWGGTRVKQAAVFAAPAASKLEVYEDEDSEEAEAGESAAAAAAAVAAAADAARQKQQQQQRGGLRQRLEAPAGAGAAAEAAQPPARLPAAAAAGPGQQQAVTRSGSSSAAAGAAPPPPPAGAAAGEGVPRGYNEALLAGPDGGEMSFEEHRAAAWRARQQARRRQQEQEQQQQQQEEEARQMAEHQQQQAAQWMQQQQQQQAAEPTVTINTRAAFDAMNGMFGGSDDTTMHAFSRAAASAAAGRRKSVGRGAAAAAVAAGADGGVTINTRAAFEAMNGMFGGSDDTTTMHAFSRAASASGSGAGLAGRGVASEPTVTINTRAAFDYMNDVFGGSGDATMGHTGALAAGARGVGNKGARSSRHSSRLSMAAPGGAGSGAGGLLGVYEDTDFDLGSKLAAAASSASAAAGGGSSGGGLGLHEDTEFINPAAAATAAAAAAFDDDSRGFYCAEDTEFLTRPVGGGGGLQLHEDTDLLTRPIGAGGGGGGMQPLLSRVNRLSLANDALTKGLANLREDSDSPSPRSGQQQLDVCADTEFLTRPVGASAAAAGGSSVSGQQQHQQPSYHDSSSAAGLQRSKENLPEDSWRQPGVGDENAGCHQQQQQQQPPAYGRSGPSRFAPGSVPSSPGPSHPAASTPGRPPRTPGTPSAAGGPWAQPLESFSVMESPAVQAALADRQQQQQPGTAGSSPAGSLAGGSPGWGARENLPGDDAPAKGALPPRSMADRAVRAAVLQPLSSSRAEALGVQVDPTATGGYEDDAAAAEGVNEGGDDGGAGQQQQQRVRQSPGRALRSLHFGRS